MVIEVKPVVPLPLTADETKAVLKAAIKEWLDERVAAFGWWSVKTLGYALLAGLILFLLTTNGWKRIV